MNQLLTEIDSIDRLLFEEINEITDFEGQLTEIETELSQEEKIVANLHNTARLTVSAIKHMHTIIRRLSETQNLDEAHKKVMRRYIDKIAMNLISISENLDALEKDENAGKKIRNYCEKVSSIIEIKLHMMKQKFNEIA